jgi:hypothetical protein
MVELFAARGKTHSNGHLKNCRNQQPRSCDV